MGADATAAVAVAAQPATHAPVKRLSHQSSGGNSPSVSLSVSVPAGSKVSSYATEEDSVAATRSISPGPPGGGGERLDYLLLGQEEYLEHHAEITQPRGVWVATHEGQVNFTCRKRKAAFSEQTWQKARVARGGQIECESM